MEIAISRWLMFVGIAFLLISFLLYVQTQSPKRLAFESYSTSTFERTDNKEEASNPPRFLLIESLDLVLPIYAAEVNNNRWQTTEKGVSYLRSSANPGEIGNSIFYGHNWKSILGNLDKVGPGDMVILSMDDGAALRYEVEFIQIVDPTDTAILNQSEDKRLTLYTCTGFLDSKRLVVTAILKS